MPWSSTIDGTTDRPDGSTYHITWSLGPGRQARESNDVLRERGWEAISTHPIPVDARAGALLMAEPQLFLDCDGVLADFDAGAKQLLGMTPSAFEARHGQRRILEAACQGARISTATLPLMPDARLLFDAVEHLKPTILTGLPLGNWAAPQKVAGRPSISPACRSSPAWRATSISTWSRGDVLVDDRENHRAAYESARRASSSITRMREDSLRQLAEIFPSVKVDAEA